MQVMPVNYRVNTVNLRKNQNNSLNFIKSNPLKSDSFSFSGHQGQKVYENWIVDDAFAYNFDYIDDRIFSDKLKDKVKNIEVIQSARKDNRMLVVKNGDKEIIRIETNKNHKNIKPGFNIGKAGTFATLKVADGKQNYKIILPEGSTLKGVDGLYVNVAGKNKDVSFTGSTATINAFYKPEKTIESVQDFIEMMKSSERFKQIKKTDVDYSEKFHPYILAGGFGTRLEPVSYSRGDNKPSTSTPIPNWNLIDFTLLNLYQANLLNKTTDVDYIVQTEANSAVGCVITTLGQKIAMTPNGLDLIPNGEKSSVPAGKNIIIMPSDNVTDIDMTEVLESFLDKPNSGMMVVGVPDYRCYGGLIQHNDKDEITNFEYKPTRERLDKRDGYVYYKDESGHKRIVRDSEGNPTSLGNAFIYIINPEILDTITDIYRDKIRTAYKTEMAKHTPDHKLTKEEYLNVIECLWDREIIPTLVKMSNNGELKNKDGDNLKVHTHESLAYWSDVGEYDSYYQIMQKVAKDDCYINLPKVLKEEAKDQILGNVIFNTDVQNSFMKLLGKNGYAEGNIVVVADKR